MKISVYITSYNQREYLREAIESVLAQTLAPAQIVVVDDRSADGSQDLIADYARRYPDLFTPLYHEENTGVAQVRVDALGAVTGDYATHLDGDDRFLPEKLEMEAAALRDHPDAGIAFSDNWYVSVDGRKRLRRWVEDEKPPEGDVFWQTFARAFPRRRLFRMELVAYEPWKRVGFHDPGLVIYEDYDMRIRLAKHLRAVYVDRPLSEIRTLETGLSKSAPDVHFRALERIYRRNAHLLDDLSPETRHKVRRMFGLYTEQIGWRAAREASRKGEHREAARFLARKFWYRWCLR